MVAKKTQLPVIGGVRKVITPDNRIIPGTTIAELGTGTVTLAQLAALLGLSVPAGSQTGLIAPAGGAGVPASLVVGPGLSGGGPLLGAVPLRLTAPIPAFIFDDSSGGSDGDAGPPGAMGATGGQGPLGPPIFLAANDGVDGQDAIPGSAGAPGATGGIGPAGAALMFLVQDGMDADWGPPGPQGAAGATGGSTSFNVSPDTHPAIPTGVGLGPNDEFETGSTIDLSGSRYAGATAWTAFNLSTATSAISQGNLVLNPVNSGANTINGYSQPVSAAGTWQYTCRVSHDVANASSGFGMFVALAGGGTGKMIYIDVTQTVNVNVQTYTNATTFTATLATVVPTGPLGEYLYLRVTYNGTNLIFSASITGVEGTFFTVATQAPGTFLGALPALVGIAANNQSATQFHAIYDWFRQTA